MLDLLFVFTAMVFFVIAILYIYGCDWFIKDDKTQLSAVDHIETSREATSRG